MYTETEGIILKQTKPVGDRKVVTLFSKNYGKITAGSRTKTSSKHGNLALGAFALGKYQLYKNKDYFYINSAETLRSFYKIGEDIEKYGYGSFAIELTEKSMEEGQPMPKLFNMLIDYLEIIENRKGKYGIILASYELKLLKELGFAMNPGSCHDCGKKIIQEDKLYYSFKDAGFICENCYKKSLESTLNNQMDSLIFEVDFGIIDIINYCTSKPLKSLEVLVLEKNRLILLNRIINNYMKHHLDIGTLKSQAFISGGL